MREQVQRESYRAGDRLVAYVIDIDKSARGPQIVISRAHKGLLEKLFEMEVPEIYDKIVRIEASAREAGARSKIAVFSRDRDVDPVGACVGMKGSRVQAVVQELRGEKIDIVPYDADPARFVCNAIAPAEVSRVLIDAAGHTMQLIVPDDKLSLAIGKKGQNVRLASQLTGWRIDIHSESKVRDMEERSRVSLAAIPGVTPELAEALFRADWRSAAEVAQSSAAELATLPGIGSAEAATRIIDAAAQAAEVERARPGRSGGRRSVRAGRARRGATMREGDVDGFSARADLRRLSCAGPGIEHGSSHRARWSRAGVDRPSAGRAYARREAGRGAWVHLGCLGQALARGALERAFRRQVEIGEQLALLARAHGAPGRPITSGNSR